MVWAENRQPRDLGALPSLTTSYYILQSRNYYLWKIDPNTEDLNTC